MRDLAALSACTKNSLARSISSAGPVDRIMTATSPTSGRAGSHRTGGSERVAHSQSARKGRLNEQGGRAVQPHVGVAPRAHLLVEPEVVVPDVVPADPGLTAVHDHDLAVVPEVELEPVARTPGWSGTA